jgi:hypothetical protein
MFGKIRNLNSTHDEFTGRLNLANSCFHPLQTASSHPPNSYRLRSSLIGIGGESRSSVLRIEKRMIVFDTRVLRSISGPIEATVIGE